jgi:hypothetical protein
MGRRGFPLPMLGLKKRIGRGRLDGAQGPRRDEASLDATARRAFE